jgi:large subunit ribosomal protein L7/L12
MSFSNDDVVNSLGNMSVMELIALTKHLEEKWGLEAKPDFSQAVITHGTTLEVQPSEQTEFNVFLVSHTPDKKMAVVKMVRELLSLGLLESKTLVESLPKQIKEGISKEDAEALKVRLTEAGATVEVK